MGIVDEAFAAVPRDLWWGGALWREPDNLEVARDLRYAGPAHEPPPRQRLTRAAIARRREEVAKLRRAGWTVAQIAAALDVPITAVDYDLKALRIAAGEHGATVAEYAARRAQVVALLDAGRSYRQIVQESGICFATVCRVGREWRKTHKETA